MSERQLLAAVHQWARLNKWRYVGWRGWVNADDSIVVRPGWNEGVLRVWRSTDGSYEFRSRDFPVESVREGVDLLCSLRILPAEMSSGYQAAADEFRGEIARLEATLGELTPHLFASSEGVMFAEALESVR